jgi:hypothetical protein
MSAFSTVVGRLGELSESELRQLYLIVGVRLGFPDGQTGKSSQGGAKGPSKSSNTAKGGGKKGSSSGKAGKNKSSKGNPSRKSQWETHPLYREYKRLKKVVGTQAKEAKLPFASVDSPERAAYNLALEAWLGAKSSFRDREAATKEGEEVSSSKGKGRAVETAQGPTDSGDPTPTDKVGRSSWAAEAQAEADGDSSSEDEDLPDAPPVVEPAGSTTTGAKPIADRRKPPVHDRPTPPKDNGGAKKIKR